MCQSAYLVFLVYSHVSSLIANLMGAFCQYALRTAGCMLNTSDRSRWGFDMCVCLRDGHTSAFEKHSRHRSQLIVASWGHHMTHLWKIVSRAKVLKGLCGQWIFCGRFSQKLCCAGFVQVMLICCISRQSNGAAFLLRIKSHKTQKVAARWMCFWHARVFCQFCAAYNA